MKRRRLALFTSISLVVIILAFWLRSEYQKSGDAVRVLFMGITNNPSLGPVAILCVTNVAVDLIICGVAGTPQVRSSSGWPAVNERDCSGLGYLERGESIVFTVPVPPGTSPWRMPVWWQRQELTRLEAFINRQRSRLLVLRGEPDWHRDAWVPFAHLIYSPETGR